MKLNLFLLFFLLSSFLFCVRKQLHYRRVQTDVGATPTWTKCFIIPEAQSTLYEILFRHNQLKRFTLRSLINGLLTILS